MLCTFDSVVTMSSAFSLASTVSCGGGDASNSSQIRAITRSLLSNGSPTFSNRRVIIFFKQKGNGFRICYVFLLALPCCTFLASQPCTNFLLWWIKPNWVSWYSLTSTPRVCWGLDGLALASRFVKLYCTFGEGIYQPTLVNQSCMWFWAGTSKKT